MSATLPPLPARFRHPARRPIGGDGTYRPKDRLKTVDTRDCNKWHIVTETDEIYVGTINHIVGGAFAAGIVEAWNARLQPPSVRISDRGAAESNKEDK